MKVSIITIAYNDLKGLENTWQSIRRQTFRDFEWIVIDGGSTDGTRKFLQEHDSEIAFWCCEPDKGAYNAQNKGTKHAKGEYCVYMNSGDVFYDDDVLEKVFEKKIDADIIYGNWLMVFENGKTRLDVAPVELDMAFFFSGNICHQAMLAKTELVLNRPYDESFQVYADWDEWLDMFVQGKRFEKVDIIFCKFMVGGLSTGSSKALVAKRDAEIERLHEKYYPELWRKTMKRAAPCLLVYEHLKSKRKQHNKLIRILIIVSSLLFVTNILTMYYLLGV